jgi:hypothetical protein
LRAGGWVGSRDLQLVFGISDRALRRDGNQPGLCSEFAISGVKGFRHVKNATARTTREVRAGDVSRLVEMPIASEPVTDGAEAEKFLAELHARKSARQKNFPLPTTREEKSSESRAVLQDTGRRDR